MLADHYCGLNFWSQQGIMLQFNSNRGWFISNQYEGTAKWIYEIPQNWYVICNG